MGVLPSMPLVLWVTVGVVIVHRWRMRRRAKDLHKIPIGPGSIPVLGHVNVLKVRCPRPTC